MNTPVKTYSARSENEMQIAPSFKVKEFQCKDGSDEIKICTHLVALLQRIRDHYGLPVTINSAYRTPAYNNKIGGASESMHMTGKAADIVVKGISPQELYDWLNPRHSGGMGKYKTFVHVDTGNNRRWVG